MVKHFVPGCKVVDAEGQVLAELSQDEGETFTMAEVTLARERPQPTRPQPRSRLSSLIYLTSDTILPFLTIPTYRRGLRRVWGKHMAPIEAETRQWLAFFSLGMAIAFLLGWLLGRRRG